MYPYLSSDIFGRHLVTSYNRGYAFSPTKSRMTVTSCHTGLTSRRQDSGTLVSLNNENLGERLNSHVDMSDEKSAFRILESAGELHITQPISHISTVVVMVA